MEAVLNSKSDQLDIALDSTSQGQKRNHSEVDDRVSYKKSCLQRENDSNDIDICDDDPLLIDDVELPVKKKYTPQEKTMGITEYIGKHERTGGLVKQRYSDFHVHEISETGEIVRLTNFDLPQEAHEEICLLTYLEKEICDKIEALANSTDGEPIAIECSNESKDKRRKIHEGIRQKYSECLKSDTEICKDVKKIIVSRKNDKSLKGNRKSWPHERPEYTEFVLYKENTDTMEAVSRIANKLKMKSSLFTYAGVKDRRAKSCQLIRVQRVDASELLKLNDYLKYMKLGNFKYTKNCLKLGDLRGNHFRIVIRDLESDENIDVALNSLKDKGFINYFGMQRFGTTSVSTCELGKAFLLGNWEEAITMIMSPREGDDADTARFRLHWAETKNARKTLKMIRRKESVEAHLLRGLLRSSPNDHVSALSSIPYKMRLMFVHSYQSYLWNHMVSRRIQKYGLDVLDGDLYIDHDNSEVFSGEKSRRQRTTPNICNKSGAVKDISIEDVVMPLPGCDIIYPANEIASWYHEALEADGFDSFHFKKEVKMFNLAGDYRKLVLRPKNMSWNVCSYNDEKIPLVASDWELFSGSSADMEITNEGQYKALTLEFSLPSSSYATMALREFLKSSS